VGDTGVLATFKDEPQQCLNGKSTVNVL
jgi:hypothetical protein